VRALAINAKGARVGDARPFDYLPAEPCEESHEELCWMGTTCVAGARGMSTVNARLERTTAPSKRTCVHPSGDVERNSPRRSPPRNQPREKPPLDGEDSRSVAFRAGQMVLLARLRKKPAITARNASPAL